MNNKWRLISMGVFLLVVVIWHVVVERKSTIQIFVDGQPTKKSLVRIDDAVTVSPSAKGVFQRPRNVNNPTLPYLFKAGENSNFQLSFPTVGEKVCEFDGDVLVVTERMTYFLFYTVQQRTEQKPAMN